jgi:hypothetical protein
MTDAELLREAEYRYLYNALTHARVEAAVKVVERSLGGPMLTAEDRSLAVHVAAVALVVSEQAGM